MEEGKKITTPHGLKNEFRDEVEKETRNPIQIEEERVGKSVMLRRDQFVTMRQLQEQKKMMARDMAFNQEAIDEYARFIDELVALPISQARQGVLSMIEKQIEVLAKQRQQSIFPRPNEVTLSALEEVFDIDTQEDDEVAAPVVVMTDDEPEELRDE